VLSAGQRASDGLTAQRRRTDISLDKFEGAAKGGDAAGAMSDALRPPLTNLLAELNRLDSVRSGIDAGTSDRMHAMQAYNKIMDSVFRVYDQLVSVPDLAIFQQASAMQSMGNGRELLSRENALISGALTSGRLSAAEHSAFSDWVSTRRYLYARALPSLNDELRTPYDEVFASPAYQRFMDLEGWLATDAAPGRPLPSGADRWKPVADGLSTTLDRVGIKDSNALSDQARGAATGILLRIVLAGGLGLVAVVISIIISVRFGRRLVRDLADLRNSALDLADVRLPSVVERLRRGEDVDVDAEAPAIKAGGSAEVEDVAQAFSSVRRTAVEAAVGQARLRKGVGHVFLNLARRKQSLLHRQLSLLDSMQRRASEPDSLEDLFRLDHLTTRMRRHAEGLIILSGSAPGRSWRKPVPIVDVIRGAVSEVEDYTRVQVLPLPATSVSGAAVADLIHLLAELVENATIFSPPQTRVQVRGEPVANGFVIEVEDRGLGLTTQEYDAINQRLASPPEFDLADSDRLGLFVVGRLAARYNASVMLRSSPYGGTTAIMLIPSAVIVDTGVPATITGTVTAEITSAPAAALPPAPAKHGTSPEAEPVSTGGGPDTSPFFTPAALRTDPVPGAPRTPTDDELVQPRQGPSLTVVPSLPHGLESGRTDPWRAEPETTEPEGSGSGEDAVAPPSPLIGRKSTVNGTHAGLPRRVRQANIAPQLRENSTPLSAPTPEPATERSPDEARALFSAFQQGARRGREDSGNLEESEDFAHQNGAEKGEK
jgi:signal transduction histidine kinase